LYGLRANLLMLWFREAMEEVVFLIRNNPGIGAEVWPLPLVVEQTSANGVAYTSMG
jgi:hypothetical protein